MQLDRNINENRRGKYALIKLRRLTEIEASSGESEALACHRHDVMEAINLLERAGVLDWGLRGTEGEFMVIRLKDRYAQEALNAYAYAAEPVDPEWAAAILEMARRSGPASPWCKSPD